MVSSLSDIPHQCPRTYGSPAHSPQDPSSSKGSYPASPLQPDIRTLHPPRRLSFSSSELSCVGTRAATPAPRLVLYSSSPQGSTEYSSRFSFEGFSPGDRVVTRQDIVPGSSTSSSRSTDRPICIPQKPQASFIHHSVPPSTSSGNGCFLAELGPMEQDLSFPASECPHEGAPQAEGLSQRSSIDSPSVTEQPMVPFPDRAVQD